MASYISVVWAKEDWGTNNQTGFELDRALRLISQWQREGLMLEMYDYAKGKGLIAWRWLERVSTLTPWPGDVSGRLFKCENGCVEVADKGEAGHEPVVYQYNPQAKARGRLLEVISFTSYWKPELGAQWYVVYRDTTRETPLRKKPERVRHDFTLPEWKPGATVGDLPYHNTHGRRMETDKE
jgi:hypothetical protein